MDIDSPRASGEDDNRPRPSGKQPSRTRRARRASPADGGWSDYCRVQCPTCHATRRARPPAPAHPSDSPHPTHPTHSSHPSNRPGPSYPPYPPNLPRPPPPIPPRVRYRPLGFQPWLPTRPPRGGCHEVTTTRPVACPRGADDGLLSGLCVVRVSGILR
jgi:hypothetical protein